MHTTWPLADIVALASLRALEAAHVIARVSTMTSLEDALQQQASLLDDGLDALRRHAAAALDKAERNGTHVITWWHDAYPQRLRGIDAPPALLWVRGTLPANDVPAIGVVGTRACTAQYGKPVTERLVDEWVDSGCAIISGLAAGVDTVAHERTLRQRGVTVAVVASGTDRISPRSAAFLADRIVESGGAVVSEYRCGQAALPPFFPQRNRIISGLSDAVVVAESAIRGGALITAEFARKHGRALFAVPGPITSTRSAGTNALIAKGHAIMACTATDVTSHLGLGRLVREPLATFAASSPQQQAIVDVLDGGAMHIDAIATLVGTNVGTALVLLLELEIAGVVFQIEGLRFARSGSV
jgi:DNA processing protein